MFSRGHHNRSYLHVFDTSVINEISARLQAREREVNRALAIAVNLAAEETTTKVMDEWNSYFKIRQDYINNKIIVAKRATTSRPEAVIWARSRSTRSNNFEYQIMPGRKGVRLSNRRGGAGGVIRNAFVIPRAKSDGKPLIIERLEKYQKGESRSFRHGSKQIGRFNRAEKLRFKALYGPSVNQYFHDARERVAPQAMTAAKAAFMKAIKA